jgi:hypothetical protein
MATEITMRSQHGTLTTKSVHAAASYVVKHQPFFCECNGEMLLGNQGTKNNPWTMQGAEKEIMAALAKAQAIKNMMLAYA